MHPCRITGDFAWFEWFVSEGELPFLWEVSLGKSRDAGCSHHVDVVSFGNWTMSGPNFPPTVWSACLGKWLFGLFFRAASALGYRIRVFRHVVNESQTPLFSVSPPSSAHVSYAYASWKRKRPSEKIPKRAASKWQWKFVL